MAKKATSHTYTLVVTDFITRRIKLPVLMPSPKMADDVARDLARQTMSELTNSDADSDQPRTTRESFAVTAWEDGNCMVTRDGVTVAILYR
jgi:hypothetical protein